MGTHCRGALGLAGRLGPGGIGMPVAPILGPVRGFWYSEVVPKQTRVARLEWRVPAPRVPRPGKGQGYAPLRRAVALGGWGQRAY